MTQSPTPDSSPVLTDSAFASKNHWLMFAPILPVTPAEYVDLLSIAEVKAAKIGLLVAQGQASREKLDAAQERLQQLVYAGLPFEDSPLHAPLQQTRATLCQVHSELWDVEDRIRELDSIVHWQDAEQQIKRDWKRQIWSRLPGGVEDALVEYISLARKVYVLNTTRSEMKRELDLKLGFAPEVKQYAAFSDNRPEFVYGSCHNPDAAEPSQE